ncbi:hypothetical protein [Xanthocytophaga flava]|uniref:hypothetical protein n=1 Tax=Xanthocytophaga flava TaxID=3048013 RepID=UPI0028D676FA|nr:hypothetical protein [Xanthocytophaga flavus]MDJ1472832.1 hypothetical protein [Xanthocytophaga flavus]
MDYLFLIISLISGLVAIAGNTWDSTKVSLIDKLTLSGKIVLSILLVTFVISVYQTYQKNKQASLITDAANEQIKTGIRYILTPLNFDASINTQNYFTTIQDTTYLSRLFKSSITNVFYNGLRGNSFEHPYRNDSIYIEKGEQLLNDAIDKYNAYLDGETIQYINEVFNNEFYKSQYKIWQNRTWINIVLEDFKKDAINREKKPHFYYSYYYNTHDKSVNSPYNGMITFIEKTKNLYSHINE